MMKQSYTSFLNNVHKKANIHIFVIKVNKSTGQRVNELRPDGSDWVWLGPIGSEGSEVTEKGKHPLNPQLDLMGVLFFLEPCGNYQWDLTPTTEIPRDPWDLCEAKLLHFCAHQVVLLVARDNEHLTVLNHLANLHFLSHVDVVHT